MTINTKQLYFILDNTPPQQNIMLVGKHGIGKSRILKEYFSLKGEKVVTLFLGQMSDPGDLIGLPEKNMQTGKTDFMLPYWFPVDNKPVVLFLDELNRARPEVLQTIMDLTLNRKLAGKSLPQGSRIISAVNNGNEYQLTDLDPALVSRFNIYEFSPTVEDWLNWAVSTGMDERIVHFISENPEFLDDFDGGMDSENLERHPDRRSWERAGEIIKKVENLTSDHKIILSGIIGNKASSMFFKYVFEHKVPSAQEILCGDFSKISAKLDEISVADFSELNISILRYLEHFAGSENSQKFDKNDRNNEIICKNLLKYFDYLEKTKRSELESHFISLCSAKEFPNALYYITEKCEPFYEIIMNTVTNIL